MAILEQNGQLNICRLSLELTEFPALLQRHFKLNPNTLVIEEQAARMAESDFPVHEVKEFVKAVCVWGGYAGMGTRIA